MAKDSSKIFWITLLVLCIIFVIGLIVVFIPRDQSNVMKELKARLVMVDPSFSNIDIREGYSSYTANKSVVYLCTRDPQTGNYYDLNTLMYVALHECTHVISKSYEHSKKHSKQFYDTFNVLLQRAAAVRVYDPSIPLPRMYCGIKMKN